jgi:adenylate kinase
MRQRFSQPIPRRSRGVFLLLGASGSGKGTVAKRLLELGLIRRHISMGDLLRELLARIENNFEARDQLEKTLSGELIPGFSSRVEYFQHCVQNGLLIPNAWTETIIENELAQNLELRSGVWALDGYPRRTQAAQHLLELLQHLKIPVLGVVHLQITLDAMQNRLKARGRTDDTPDAIENRFDFYREYVLPTIEFLKIRDVQIHEINTATSETDPQLAAQEVLNRVLEGLEPSLTTF